MLQLELLPNECIRLRYSRLNYILNTFLETNDMLFCALMQYGFCRFTRRISASIYISISFALKFYLALRLNSSRESATTSLLEYDTKWINKGWVIEYKISSC